MGNTNEMTADQLEISNLKIQLDALNAENGVLHQTVTEVIRSNIKATTATVLYEKNLNLANAEINELKKTINELMQKKDN